MEIEFIPLDYDYFDWQGRNYVKIIGRTKQGKRACIIDSFQPYFWAIFKQATPENKIKKIQEKINKIKVQTASRTTKVEKTEIHNKNFLGKPVKAIKIFVTNFKDAHAVADKIGMKEIDKRREYDLTLITKYIIDKKLIPLKWYIIKGEILNNSQEFGGIDAALDVDLCMKVEKIKEPEGKVSQENRRLSGHFQPKILAFDIEADEFEIGKGKIVMISLVSDKIKKVLTWKKCKASKGYVECFKDEADMLEAFVKYIKQEKPDIIAGYFSDGFDLPYLRARAAKNNIKLSIGIDNSQPRFSGGRIPSGKISGIVHTDIFRFIQATYSQYLQSETLSLNEVANELLGERKKDFKIKHSSKLDEQEWHDYFAYNLQDSILTYKLAEKLWPDMIEFSKVMQEPLFEITRNSMSKNVESYIFHNLEKFNEIAEKHPTHEEIGKRRMRPKYIGAFVLQPKPALYENLAIFDFTSMYASIIVSFNLSLASFSEKNIKDAYEADIDKRKAYFSKKPSFFPQMLAEIVDKRKKFKQELRKKPDPFVKARSNAFKLLANASYGYQGFFGARYYCPEAAASTAYFARKFIKQVINKTNKQGYKVIYADTDGFAFLVGKKTKAQTLKFLDKLNSSLPGIMELELEDFYKRGIWVLKRTGEFGAKKKYALITEQGKVKIRGFETVRRDWCQLAREMQNKVLRQILTDGNQEKALKYTKQIIKKLKKREIEKDKLIIRTQLKKPLSEYKAISPHVTIARKMLEQEMPVDIGMLIEYYIAESKEKRALVRDRAKMPDEKGEYDINYYIKHQIIPAVENIFEIFSVDIKEATSDSQQKKLF